MGSLSLQLYFLIQPLNLKKWCYIYWECLNKTLKIMVFFLSRFQDYIYIILNIMETALLTFLFTSHLYPFGYWNCPSFALSLNF